MQIDLNNFKQVFQDEINSLILAQSKISDNYFKASELIALSNKVILSGIGKSGLIAKKIAATLSSYNISSVFLHPVEALHGDIGIIQENDVVILLSKSGSTEEIVRLVPFIKSRNAKIISIVTNPNSFLGKNSDVTLEASVTKEACPFNLAPTSSTTVTLAIGDAISVVAAQIRDFRLEDFSKTHPLGSIGKKVSLKVKDVMQSGENIPYIFNEADFKEIIIGISEKGLGCIIVVDDNYQLMGIITDGDVRRALQSGKDIFSIKATEIMTKKPVSINENQFVDIALTLMENRLSQLSSLVVLDEDNRVSGLIRLHDIVRSGI